MSRSTLALLIFLAGFTALAQLACVLAGSCAMSASTTHTQTAPPDARIHTATS